MKVASGDTGEHNPYRPEIIDLVEFPPMHDFEYRVRASRLQGEEVIRELAIDDDVEHLFTFDGNNIWRHYDAPYYRVVGDEEALHGITLTQNFTDELRRGVSMYHTHPASFFGQFHAEDQDRELYAAIPSSNDLEAFLRCVPYGMQESRIMTKYGMTTISMSADARNRYAATGTVSLDNINLPRTRIQIMMHLAGRRNGIKKVLSELNDGLGENVDVSYSPFDERQ